MGSSHVQRRLEESGTARILVCYIYAVFAPLFAFAIVQTLTLPSPKEVKFLLHRIDHGLSLLHGLELVRAVVCTIELILVRGEISADGIPPLPGLGSASSSNPYILPSRGTRMVYCTHGDAEANFDCSYCSRGRDAVKGPPKYLCWLQ